MKKLSKNYQNKDRYLLIVLYGKPATNLRYISDLNNEINNAPIQNIQNPENFQVVSIHEFLDFIGLDSNLYTNANLKATVDRLRKLADDTQNLLTGRENAFSKRKYFEELRRLGDDSKAYLDTQPKNNYLGSSTKTKTP